VTFLRPGIIIIIATYFKCRNRLNGAKKLGSMCQQHLKSVSKKIKYEKKLNEK